jgi:hypothetical protein
MDGIDTVNVHAEAKIHPHLRDVFTLGECETSHLSDPTGTEPFRSIVHLYYGSFMAMAEQDPRFDLEDELEETIEHEVQHHIEDRAGASTLRDEDALFEAHARFRSGRDVPNGWYRYGDLLEPGLWAVDLDLFLELPIPRARFEAARGRQLDLTLLDEPLVIDLPADADADEIWTFEGQGLCEGDDESDAEGVDEDQLLCGDLHVMPYVR